jgi:hypothetical protein
MYRRRSDFIDRHLVDAAVVVKLGPWRCGNLQELLDGAMAKMPLLSISGRKRERERERERASLSNFDLALIFALLSSLRRLPLSRNFEHNTALSSSSNSCPARNIFAVAVNEIRIIFRISSESSTPSYMFLFHSSLHPIIASNNLFKNINKNRSLTSSILLPLQALPIQLLTKITPPVRPGTSIPTQFSKRPLTPGPRINIIPSLRSRHRGRNRADCRTCRHRMLNAHSARFADTS